MEGKGEDLFFYPMGTYRLYGIARWLIMDFSGSRVDYVQKAR